MQANKKLIVVTLILLSFFMISAVSAASDTETSVNSDVTHKEKVSHTTKTASDTISNNMVEKTSASTDSASAEDILNENEKSKSKTHKSSVNGDLLKEDETPITVNNWTELKSNITGLSNDASFILGGSDDEYLVNSAISIPSKVKVTIDGKGKTLKSNNTIIFSYGTDIRAELVLKNLKLINSKGSAIHGAFNLTVINCTFQNDSTQSTDRGGAINGARNAHITIINCTFTENSAIVDGGVIYINNNGTLIIVNSTFNNNTALGKSGGTGNTGTGDGGVIYTERNSILNIINTQFNNNSGHRFGIIYVEEYTSLNLMNSTINNNKCGYGGAIYATGHTNINITNTTLNNNTATNRGGAIYATGHTNININNSTINNNTATNRGGAIYTEETQLTIVQTTLSNNTATRDGGAICANKNNNIVIIKCNFNNNHRFAINGSSETNINITDTLFQENTMKNTRVIYNASFVNIENSVFINEDVYRLEYDDDTKLFYTENITDSIEGLGTLISVTEKNGHKNEVITATIGANSYTLEFNDAEDRYVANITSLQPGKYIALINFIDPQGNIATVKTNEFTVISNKSFTALNYLINNKTDTDINLKNNYQYNETIDAPFKNGIPITSNVHIIGNGHSIDGLETARIFRVTDGGNLILENLTLTKGQGQIESIPDAGDYNVSGAIYADNGKVALINATLTQNIGVWKGGAIYAYNSQLNINNSTLQNNTATYGGAIYAENSQLNINNSTLQNNTATYGGAIYICAKSNVSVSSSLFLENSADSYGGAIQTENSQLNINNSTINNNTAKWGGAIRTSSSYLNMTTTEMNNNIADHDGGAIHAENSQLNISNTILNNNNVTINGGAIYSRNSNVTLNDTKFKNNNAIGSDCQGGAIYAENSQLNITKSTFENNTEFNSQTWGSTAGGGAIGTYNSQVNISNTAFTNNNAKDQGGAIYTRENSQLNINNSTINNNNADYGGAIHAENSQLNINNSTINNNTAIDGNGGAIHTTNSQLNINNSTINNNTATRYGGAIYSYKSNMTITQTTFKQNSVSYSYEGGAIYAGMESNINITGSLFTDNRAHQGSAICGSNFDNLTVKHNIFLNNTGKDIIYLTSLRTHNIEYNWFGNNASNYNITQNVNKGILKNWLFLNATANPNTIIGLGGSSSIIFRLQVYTPDAGISNYTDGQLKPVNLTITSVNGEVTPNNTVLDNPIEYTPSSFGTGSVTASISNVKYTINLGINKEEKTTQINNLSVPETLYQNKDPTINGTLVVDGTGLANQDIIISVTNSAGYEHNYTASTDSEGKFSQIINEDTVGDINITVIYKGNETGEFIYKASNDTKSAKIVNVNYTIEFNPLEKSYDYNSTVTIRGIVKSNYYPLDVNKINITINGGEIISADIDADGMFTYAIKDMTTPGPYTVLANCNGYTNATTFFIKYPTHFTITVTNSTTDKPVNVTVHEDNNFTGTIKVNINGTDYEVTLTNGEGTNNNIIINKVGNYTATIDYPGNETHNATTANSNTFSIKYPTHFTITVTNSTTDKPVNVTVHEDNNFTGTIKVNINGIDYDVILTEGDGTNNNIIINKPGNYTATINYEGNETYNATIANSNTFNIKYPTNLTITVSNSTTDKPINIILHEDNGLTGEVIFVLDGKTYYLTLQDGEGTRNNITINKTGGYTIDLTYPGDETYAPASTSTKFYIKYPTQFTITTSNSTTDKPVTITVHEDNNFTGTIKVNINGIDYEVTLTDGDGNSDAITLPLGNYTATINYEGNETYNATTTTSSRFYIKYPTQFTITTSNSTTDKPINITVSEANGFTGTIKVNINGKDYEVTLTDGEGTDNNIIINKPGNYTATINYEGNETYNATTAKSNTFNIKYQTRFIIEVNNSTPDKAIIVTVKEENGFSGTIKVNVNGTDYEVTLTDGEGTSDPITLPLGKYSATINYGGDETYNATTASQEFYIKHPTSFIIVNIPDITEGSSIDLIVTEKNNYTGPVTVTIGSETYTVTLTNGTGKTSITPKLSPGTYTASISFPGNEEYSNTTIKSNTFKVSKKASTKINTKISASKKTYYTKNTNKKYSITLKTKTGKAINKAKVTLKVKGKTYKAVTNSKGVATFKITKLNKKGRYTAIIRFAGNDKYNKASQKVKITIKKSKDKYDVKKIQRALKKNGYYRYACHRYLLIDGIYHKWTRRAVKQFQKAKKLKVTGKVDYTTAKKLGII